MPKIIRYQALDGLGQVRLDLDECVRRIPFYWHEDANEYTILYGIISAEFFLTPDGRWIEHIVQDMDILDQPPDPRYEGPDFYREVTPPYVIQELSLLARELPKDLAGLEAYREAMRQVKAAGRFRLYGPTSRIDPLQSSKGFDGQRERSTGQLKTPRRPVATPPGSQNEDPENAGGDTSLRTPAAPSQRLKEPSDRAFAAYRLVKLGGRKQHEVAKELYVDQGTVSRWLTSVAEWIKAGNMLPDELRVEPSRRKPMTMDPSKLEQGPRLDRKGRAARGVDNESDRA
jgi:hypothetical protein